ncbi:MAG: hypothetical protein H0Z32_13380 [Bacillaceae bacterium]|nr:hypothetical protein [Bacillaceae bacterium]
MKGLCKRLFLSLLLIGFVLGSAQQVSDYAHDGDLPKGTTDEEETVQI